MWNAFLDHEQLFTFEKKCCVSSPSGLITQWQHYLPGELPVPEQCEIPPKWWGSALPSSRPPKTLLCRSGGSERWHKANYGNRVGQTYQGNSLYNGNLARFLKGVQSTFSLGSIPKSVYPDLWHFHRSPQYGWYWWEQIALTSRFVLRFFPINGAERISCSENLKLFY